VTIGRVTVVICWENRVMKHTQDEFVIESVDKLVHRYSTKTYSREASEVFFFLCKAYPDIGGTLIRHLGQKGPSSSCVRMANMFVPLPSLLDLPLTISLCSLSNK
jgi:hypothetical protein